MTNLTSVRISVSELAKLLAVIAKLIELAKTDDLKNATAPDYAESPYWERAVRVIRGTAVRNEVQYIASLLGPPTWSWYDNGSYKEEALIVYKDLEAFIALANEVL